MKKTILTAFISMILLTSTSCVNEVIEPLYAQELAPSPTSSPIPTAVPEPPPPQQYTPEAEQDLYISNTESDNLEPEPPLRCRNEALANAGLSEYGWQVAVDFLRDFTSLFAGIDGLYTAGRVTELYFSHDRHSRYAFFDMYGNPITDEPWIYTMRFERNWYGEPYIPYSYEHYYANYFSLFDFDNTGIPDIIIHFSQTFCGCYASFYRVFRYVDGAYKMLGMTAFSNNEQLDWVSFGSIHELFIAVDGRVITFINCVLFGAEYNHIVISDRVELHRIALTTDNYDWAEWSEKWDLHHWEIWEQTPYGHILVSSWRDYNPTIFGTDISLTPLHPFEELGALLYAYLYNQRTAQVAQQ